MKKILFVFAALFVFWGCEEETEKEEDNSLQLEKDIEIIESYLLEHNIDAISTPEGVYYIIKSEGAGEKPNASSTVTVKYTGMLLDGTVFDYGTTSGLLTQYIEGWVIGLTYFPEGSKGKLFIPSTLAYKEQSSGSIPPNSVLIFDVNLIDVSDR